MTQTFDAVATIQIDAPVERVWEALIDPDQVAKYLHGTTMETDWKIGGPITWSGEWKGQPYVDKGEVLAFEPPRMLRTTHWSPMSGVEDKPENYHVVTYELAESAGGTTLTLTQSNNPTQEAADSMVEQGWKPVLNGLKQLVESTRG
jgi:uncharacterized protein YndB with AHSA1/START domain